MLVVSLANAHVIKNLHSTGSRRRITCGNSLCGLLTESMFLMAGFAAGFALLSALCSAAQMRSTPIVNDEVKVLNQENVAGPVDVELLTDCRRQTKTADRKSARCHESSRSIGNVSNVSLN